ncbi:heterokaryon incompatibility protein-domain-containing protein [Microdochium trichocladiopsis]|uniref:Heterokaryon incompatibility protein-domain-containing protein n=1 Tax=Microdochium trichocladiopsis TaxID=1682393 RepID=A0A9P9BH91_9PEZI|nr:heterokaryon incompatibility protein-domain-containing protein [Microdochium trichocladiopsis]KAH7018239.1 heterokaryon incompatibility protein-domain-containing protein [Microdochium trichocladiopsis]
MRLVNTATERLVQLVSPPAHYAILSHTWDVGEVSFQDVENGCAPERRGYAKFQGAVKLARDQGYKYIWIDNCCIDKSSSAELSEAINSMFTWYRRSSKCYVYLHDVSASPEHSSSSASASTADNSPIHDQHFRQQLNRSRWFLRSWTLQELIAPSSVHFYDRGWTWLGIKNDPAWTGALNELTGISYEVLQYPEGYKNASVAQRMSWAANREATREEDISYSLFGVFDINMAPLYGEGGPSAFRRLQEEIIRRHADDSILAWNPAPHDAKSWSQSTYALHRGLAALAHSPACFRDARDIVHFLSPWAFELENMAMTPLGLLLEAPVIHKVHGSSTATASLSPWSMTGASVSAAYCSSRAAAVLSPTRQNLVKD